MYPIWITMLLCSEPACVVKNMSQAAACLPSCGMVSASDSRRFYFTDEEADTQEE